MALEDIVTRDSLDGAAQLALLRSYLKDTNEEQFPDDYLIALLVLDGRFKVWRSLVGIPELTELEVFNGVSEVVPWSYDADNPTGHVNTIRAITGDTTELALNYTDYDLNNLMKVMPLKRVYQAILANVAQSTLPTDRDHPLRIIRELLGDTDVGGSPTYTDDELMTSMLSRCLGPYDYVLALIDISIAENSVGQSMESSGGFAAIDGITFSAEKSDGTIETAVHHRDVVSSAKASSVYARPDEFANYVDGVDISTEMGGWYAV